MKKWIIGIVIVALLVVVGGPFVYFHFIETKAPPKLSISNVTVPSTAAAATGTTTGSGSSSSAPLAGTWKISTGSIVRYRVKETLFGQSATAVGSTSTVTGSLTIAGTQLTKAAFSVDMTTVKSDRSQRDDQFQGRIMDTSDFPTGTFTLTSPIALAPVAKDGVEADYTAKGKLMLHGKTNDVTLTLQTKRTGNVIVVVGSTPITFSDYDIGNPSGGPASVGNSGTLEFALQFQPVT
jgi:polyisoprenoid-binding protein YceI